MYLPFKASRRILPTTLVAVSQSGPPDLPIAEIVLIFYSTHCYVLVSAPDSKNVLGVEIIFSTHIPSTLRCFTVTIFRLRKTH